MITIGCKNIFVKMLGSASGGLLLSQLCYWSGKMNHREFYKIDAELEDEIGISIDQIKLARKKLISLALIEVKKKGTPSKNHYKVSREALEIGRFVHSVENPLYDNRTRKPHTETAKNTPSPLETYELVENPLSGKPTQWKIHSLVSGKSTHLSVENPLTTTEDYTEDYTEEEMRARKRKRRSPQKLSSIFSSSSEKSFSEKQPKQQTAASSQINQQPSEGVKIMYKNWDSCANGTGSKTTTINPGDLSAESLRKVQGAWDELGEKGWNEVLEMYKQSAYLQGKTAANNYTPFSFLAVIEKRKEILEGKYTGGFATPVVEKESPKTDRYEYFPVTESYIDVRKPVDIVLEFEEGISRLEEERPLGREEKRLLDSIKESMSKR